MLIGIPLQYHQTWLTGKYGCHSWHIAVKIRWCWLKIEEQIQHACHQLMTHPMTGHFFDPTNFLHSVKMNRFSSHVNLTSRLTIFKLDSSTNAVHCYFSERQSRFFPRWKETRMTKVNNSLTCVFFLSLVLHLAEKTNVKHVFFQHEIFTESLPDLSSRLNMILVYYYTEVNVYLTWTWNLIDDRFLRSSFSM